MATGVILINICVAAFNFYLAWKLWKLRGAIATVSEMLVVAERNTHAVLSRAPQFVLTRQQGTRVLRQRYRHTQLQLQQVQQILALFLLLSNFGRSIFRPKTQRRRAFFAR
ncbi:MAG: hypothetical protein SW833_13930 [Cyanobacteriota bacterium]|nr:hypothetical protein [Cyanobacteriota bacterium]